MFFDLFPAYLAVQGSFDALVSFAFNAGLGNLQRSQIRMRASKKTGKAQQMPFASGLVEVAKSCRVW